MRKTAMVIVMIMLVGAYIFMIQREPNQKNENVTETITEKITTESFTQEVPQSPEELITMHNQLMKATYNSQTTEADVPELVAHMRKLYSKEFLEMNTQEDQEMVLKAELVTDETIGVYLLESQLEYTKYNEKENEAEAVVLHQTTKGDQKRVYHLMLEDGLWKINSWENITPPQKPEEK